MYVPHHYKNENLEEVIRLALNNIKKTSPSKNGRTKEKQDSGTSKEA